MGGVGRGCGRGHPFFRAMAGFEMALLMFYNMGWVGFSTVADEATHWYPHCLYTKGDKGDRGGLSAVAEDVDFRGSGLYSWAGGQSAG